MKVKFWVVGKTSDTYILPGLNDYNKRLTKYCNYEYLELPAAKLGKKANEIETKLKEERSILEKLEKSDFLILLDEKGKEFSSKGFGDYLQHHQMIGTKTVIFLIGGAYGFSQLVYQRANAKIALSQMTFTHQMVRLIFSEQLYRGFTLTKGEKYHH
jgi:23S rRNA (pseudouridine1915-N3)-methyltransferase